MKNHISSSLVILFLLAFGLITVVPRITDQAKGTRTAPSNVLLEMDTVDGRLVVWEVSKFGCVYDKSELAQGLGAVGQLLSEQIGLNPIFIEEATNTQEGLISIEIEDWPVNTTRDHRKLLANIYVNDAGWVNVRIANENGELGGPIVTALGTCLGILVENPGSIGSIYNLVYDQTALTWRLYRPVPVVNEQ